MSNIILNTDSYKPSHWLQYPPNTQYVYSYIESRGSAGDHNIYENELYPLPMKETVFFGLQMFMKEYLSKPITKEDIDEAEELIAEHIPGHKVFNKQGWEYILSAHDGYLPLEIRSVPEGIVMPVKNAMVSVINTDPEAYWLTSYIETALIRLWYPVTVATISWRIKQLFKKFWEETSDSPIEALDFKLHDFGSRGVSSKESAGIGGLSHLVNFKGTDTIEALLYARKYYDTKMAGFSIPAAEHSSITTWGKENEAKAYKNMLDKFAHPNSLVAVVSDSYDIYNAAYNIWGEELKQQVIDSGATVIVRPDSGDPTATVINVLFALEEKYGVTVNSKGYKVLNHIRVIQGDGINERSIKKILEAMKLNKFSIDNVAFGMGGALLQQMDRDTFKFAMKASAASIDGEWIDVFKDPVTDPGKHSKKGKVTYIRNVKSNKKYTTTLPLTHPCLEDMMQTVYKNGEILKTYTLDEVRRNANES